jgi:hypothetical protein
MHPSVETKAASDTESGMSSSAVTYASSLQRIALLAAPFLLHTPIMVSICERQVEFFVIVTWLIMALFPYLCKSSKYYKATGTYVHITNVLESSAYCEL